MLNNRYISILIVSVMVVLSKNSVWANEVMSTQQHSKGNVNTTQNGVGSSIHIWQENVDAFAEVQVTQDNTQQSTIIVEQGNALNNADGNTVSQIHLLQNGVSDSSMTLVQEGLGNNIHATQSDNNGLQRDTRQAVIEVDVTGNHNQLELSQVKSINTRMDVTVEGNDNQANLYQEPYSDHSVMELTQSGNDNVANMAQLKSSNRMSLIQDGDNNQAELLQSNNKNTMNIQQQGDDLYAKLTQNGKNNTMNFIQSGSGGSIELTQN